MCMCTRGCQMMVTEISKTTSFLAHFHRNMFVYWLAIPFIDEIFSMTSLFQLG